MEQETPEEGAPAEPEGAAPPGRDQPPQHGWAPGLAGGQQAPHVSTPGLPPTPGLGEQQGYASHPGLLPSAQSAPPMPFGGAYAPEAGAPVQPGLLPERIPAAESPAVEWREDQTPPGGWSEPPPVVDGADSAEWLVRALAAVVDISVWLVAYLLLAVTLGLAFGIGALASGDGSLLGTAGLSIAAASFVVYAAYTGFSMTRAGRRNGQTLGKRVFGIRVVRVDGRPVTLATVALREWLLKFVVFGVLASLTLYLATLLNYLRPLWNGGGRAYHDSAAGTRVVAAG